MDASQIGKRLVNLTITSKHTAFYVLFLEKETQQSFVSQSFAKLHIANGKSTLHSSINLKCVRQFWIDNTDILHIIMQGGSVAQILSGKELAETMRREMKSELVELKQRNNLVPGLAVILVGDDPASLSYVTGKEKACAEVGIISREYKFAADYTEEALLHLITTLNHDTSIHGILVQLPLPDHIDEESVLYALDPAKDIDGFHPVNVGRLMIGAPGFLPCTPHGIQQLLLRNTIDVSGKHVVIVGRSNIVGKPLAMILVQKKKGANATVTLCHTGTTNMGEITRLADILIVAAGRPHTVTADMVKDGAVVIDVGVNRIEDKTKKQGFRLIGDVDFEEVSKKASAISPVPGGVGPMTITMLLHNTIQSAKNHAGIA
jgi:methylenetetrahydrofolate dehydrogenase (NADP+)/methenyltetrahydrofolate cyclohydrolase